jgi:hypothetical protein
MLMKSQRIHTLQLATVCAAYCGLMFSYAGEAAAVVVGPQIYWADTGNKIRRANAEGSGLVTTITNSQIANIGDFVTDWRTDLVYINDGFNIYRSNLDGSNFTSIFQFPPFAFRGDITIDSLTNQLFFVDGRNNIIYQSNLDGSGATTIVPVSGTPSNGAGIRELGLDLSAGKLYWNFASTFHRTNLDGTQDEVLFTSPDSIGDFELDTQDGKIYWTTVNGAKGGGKVRRANINGSQQETLVSNLWGASGIALDLPEAKMFYTDAWESGPTNYDSTVRIANLDGTSPQTVLDLGPSAVNLPFELELAPFSVPEPSAALLAFTALGGLAAVRRTPTSHNRV